MCQYLAKIPLKNQPLFPDAHHFLKIFPRPESNQNSSIL